MDGSGLAEKAANFADSRRSALACPRSWPWHDSTNAQPRPPQNFTPEAGIGGTRSTCSLSVYPQICLNTFFRGGQAFESKQKTCANYFSSRPWIPAVSGSHMCSIWGLDPRLDSAHRPQLYLIVCPLVGKLDWIDKAWTPSFGKDGLVGVWQRRMVWMRIHRESRGLRR